MSPLTKAFVVLTTVLAVLLVALVVPFVAQTEEARTEISALQAQVRAAEEAARLKDLEIQQIEERIAGERQQMTAETNAMAARLSEMQGRLQDVQAQASQGAAQMTDLRASIAQFSAAAQQDAELLSTLRAELNEARNQLIDTRGKNIEQADVIVALQAEMASLERQVRRVQEQLVAAEQEATQLQDQLTRAIEYVPTDDRAGILGGPAQQGALAAGTPTTQPVRGQVTGVRELDGTTLVQVDIGRADGVEAGNRLIVARGQDFLGTLVLDEVRDQEAAGRLVLQQGTVQAGDTILGGAGF